MVLSFPTYLISCDSITINQARIFIRIAKKKKKKREMPTALLIWNASQFSNTLASSFNVMVWGVTMSLLLQLPDRIQSFTLALIILKLIIKFNLLLVLINSQIFLQNLPTPRILELQSKFMGLLPITLWERRVGGGVNSGEQDSAKPKALSATSYLSSTVKEPVAKWHTVLEVEAKMIVSINILGSIGITTCYVLV